MQFGKFINNGQTYRIHTPQTPSQWTNPLFNDEYLLEVDQRLQGKSAYVEQYNRHIIAHLYRYFYLVDHTNGQVFDINHLASEESFDHYQCDHSIADTQLTVKVGELSLSIRGFVPSEGKQEYWTVSVTNQANHERQVSLFSAFGLYDHGVMGGSCDFHPESDAIIKYAHPYHTMYHEKQQVESQPSYIYLLADTSPVSVDMSQRRFFGGDNLNLLPQAVKQAQCSNVIAEAEDFIAAMQHQIVLMPNETKTVNLQFGIAQSEKQVAKQRRALSHELVESYHQETLAYWQREYGRFSVDTPDENINFLTNHWLKKQVTLLCRQNRGTTYCPVRNQLQDAMGYALINPQKAQQFMLDVLAEQRPDGFIQQWHFTDGTPPRGLCLLNHTDGPLWLVICLIQQIKQLGSLELFAQHSLNVEQRLFNAIDYMYHHRGDHGLCIIGDGDWNDPINGVGREGKGESTWSTMALVYCINEYLSLVSHLEKYQSQTTILLAMRGELTRCINTHCWDGQWYVAGFDDFGVAYGSQADNNRLFLNAQTWAIISGVVSEQHLPIMQQSMKRLETPFGPLLLDPTFEQWDARWGRVSVKKSGTTENGSVYCHASMFKAYADAVNKNGNALYDVISRTLPTHPEGASLQLPLFISNYYFGLRESANYGRSSMHYGTGTSAWMLLVVLESLLGVKSEVEGIRIEPCLPSDWNQASCTRVHKDARYDIQFTRGDHFSISVDGEAIEGNLLPYKANKRYEIEVTFA